MSVRKLGWSCLCLVLFGCPVPTPAGECGGEACSDQQRCDAETLHCVVDDPPEVMVNAPANPVSSATFAVTGTITDDDAVTASEWRLGADAFVPLVLAADGTFNIIIDAPLLDSQTATLTVRARDRHQQTSVDKMVLIDRVGPVITFVSPAADGFVTTPSLTVEVDVTDPGRVQAVTVELDGQLMVAATDLGSGRWTAAVPTAVEEQGRQLTVVARDSFGNTSTATRSVKIDRIAPTITMQTPAANSVHIIAATPLAVTTSADTAEVTASIDANTVTLMGGPSSWTASQLTLPSLDEVTASIHVVARDFAGNTASIDQPILIDTVAPQVVITAPLAASIHRANIAMAANTIGAADTVTATLEGITVPLTGGPGAWAGTLVAPQHDFAGATLRVTARDAHGNSSFAEVAISVDTVAPVIAFTAPGVSQKFKASDFASNPNVTSTWTVSDADPQAATTTVNGSASTALSVSQPTNATDNPVSYVTTVVAADRAGNTSTSSISYSVDRVAPVIVSWTPAAGLRNVDLARSDILFSEPVFSASPISAALRNAVALQQPGDEFWDATHSLFQLSLAASRGRVVTLSVNRSLTDNNGNPLAAPADRTFHLATLIPSGTLLASNVSTFAATSDPDGVLRVSYLTTGGVWRFAGDNAPGLFDTAANAVVGTRVAANSWSTVDPVSLNAPLVWSSSIYDSATSQYFHSFNGANAFASTMGATVTAPPLNHEPLSANAPYGIVLGANYTRGTFTRAFTTIADMITAQSADSWIVASFSGTQVRWSRYRCNSQPGIGQLDYVCGGTEYGGTVQPLSPDRVEAAMTRGGTCLIVNVRAPQGAGFWYGGWAQRLENCDSTLGRPAPASCTANTSLPLAPGTIKLRIAPFSANGEDTILFAYPAGTPDPSEYRLEKMQPGACSFATTQAPIFSVPNVRDFQPVQIGNKPAFIYVNTSNELRVHVP